MSGMQTNLSRRGMLRLDSDSRFTAERLPPGRYQLILLRRDGLLAPVMDRVDVACL